jgi:hypothetical protein
VPGCFSPRVGGEKSPDAVINELRDEKDDLAREVARLEADLDRKLAQIGQLESQLAQGKVSVEGVKAGDIPRVVKIELTSYSMPVDTDDDGKDDTLRLLARPSDQSGRAMPVAGIATIALVAKPAEGDAITLVEKRFNAKELEAAYRSGFTGTHYRLEADIPAQAREKALAEGTALLATVVVTDAATGAKLTTSRGVSIK